MVTIPQVIQIFDERKILFIGVFRLMSEEYMEEYMVEFTMMLWAEFCPSSFILGNKAYKEVIKDKWSYRAGALIY